MWAEVNGERKKVACGPCIRGHRSSKCDHRDRVLVEVRKPGRPLSSCPHPSGSCSCERVVINYTIPKSSECACPSERAQSTAPTATIAGNSRIQKNRRRSTVINTAALEKAIRAGQDAETDTSSVTRTPTERSGSNEPSPLSSASSTPRLLPAQNGTSSCCKPKPIQPEVQQGGCCSKKAAPIPEPVPVKSCCSGPKTQTNTIPNGHQNMMPQFGPPLPYQIPPQFHAQQYQNFQHQGSGGPPLPLPFGLGAPIYNHIAAAYQHTASIPMSPVLTGPIIPHAPRPQVTQHAPEHNCHCGDSCSCFGCAAHPNNATMMEYVRLMAQFQYTGDFGTMPPPLYDLPTYPHHPGYGAEAFNAISAGMSTPATPHMNYHGSMNPPALPGTPMTASGPWQQSPISAPMIGPQFLEPTSYAVSSPIDGHHMLKTEETVTSPIADSPSDGKDEETPTLSPSSYFWNQMVLPSCSDATGTCQCGDGCECVGCLTHGGHNGVPLEAPAISEHAGFPDFPTNEGLHLNSTTNFMDFDTTPT